MTESIRFRDFIENEVIPETPMANTVYVDGNAYIPRSSITGNEGDPVLVATGSVMLYDLHNGVSNVKI